MNKIIFSIFLILLVIYVKQVVALNYLESNENSTNIHRYDWVEHYASWYPEIDLSGYIFSFNNGTRWTNDSWIESNASSWTNVTKQVVVNKNIIIEWMVYVNDTNNTWDVTSIRNYTIQNSLPIHSTPLLVSTDNPLNTSSADLICYNQTTTDLDGDKVRNVYSWFKNEIPYENLILTFDTNSTIKDYSVYNNSGNLYGQPTWISEGKVGGAYIFDGVDDFVNIFDNNNIRFGTSDFSISFWIKTAISIERNIIVKGTGAKFYHVSLKSGKVWIQLYDGTNSKEKTSSVFVNDSVWHHVSATFDRDASMCLYIDSVLQTPCVNISSVGDISKNVSLYIAKGALSGGYLTATIDEIRIYSYALSSEQIKALYNLEYNKIVSQETKTNDVWMCSITPNDGEDDGITLNSTSITIQYVPPSIEAKIYPLMPNKTTNIKLNATCKTDSDNVIVYWNWYKNNVKQPDLSGNTNLMNNIETEINILSNSTINKYEEWFAEIWCNDGVENSSKINTTHVIVQDTPPTKLTLSDIDPKDAYKNSKLIVTASGSIDIDNDETQYFYKWNTSTITLSNWSTNNTLDCKSAENCKKGLTIYACARASAAYSTSPEICKSIKIKNSAPTAPSTPQIQSKANIDTVLIAPEGSGSKDDDNDTITYYYEWRGSDDKTVLQPLSAARVFSCNYTKNCNTGTTFHLHLRAYDGEAYSDYSLPASIYIEEKTVVVSSKAVEVPIKESENTGQITGLEILPLGNINLTILLLFFVLIIYIFRKKIKKEKIYKIKQYLRLDSRAPIAIAILLLIYCPILLIEGREVFANEIATYAYYFLVIGVIWQFISYLKENWKKQRSFQFDNLDISDVNMLEGNNNEKE